MRRLGLPDRINHLYPFRLGPWSRDTSVECFDLLAKSHGLRVEDGVANAVYEALGVGIPHHVQSFFARLRDFTTMQGRDRVTVEDVDDVYRTALLGPSGQNDLVHYETRLKEGLEDESYSIAMEILAEAATQEVFTPAARRCLERLYSKVTDDAASRIADALEVLVHDGYLEADDDGYRFPSTCSRTGGRRVSATTTRPLKNAVLRTNHRSGRHERSVQSADPQVQSGDISVR